MKANIHSSAKPRVVIVGGGLGGLELVSRLKGSGFQVVLIDKNNYNQFPPLIYQVASSGLEPSNIAFPFRRLFQRYKEFYFRMGKVLAVDTEQKRLRTTFGRVDYDVLVLAAGATTNFFGNANVEAATYPMKSVTEGIRLRNVVLQNLEEAITEDDAERRQALLNIVIVGGGPSGVEIAGALADMKQMVVPRDYPDLDYRSMNIYLLDAADRLLGAMSPKSSAIAERDLMEMGVMVKLNSMVTDYSDGCVRLKDGTTIKSDTVVWVSGIRANTFDGISGDHLGRGARIITDRFCRVNGLDDVYAIGDGSIVDGDEHYPGGHPQLAQVAIQQARLVARNLRAERRGKEAHPFAYRNLGTMATIGRKKAVVEIGKLKFGGFVAWMLWLVVHLRSILGVKNKTVVFLNWMWNYFNYTQSLRLILKPKPQKPKC